MAKVAVFEIEQCMNIYNVKIEIDDVFDEVVENGLEIGNEEEVQYIETDDVFDEVVERQIDMSCHNIDLENKLSLAVKCVYKEEEDDIFDEEQEKGEPVLPKHDVDVKIKIEVEDGDDSCEKKNLEDFGSFADIIKEENGVISDTKDMQHETLVKQNVNDTIFIEADEQKIKLEDNVETKERTNESSCRKHNSKATQEAIEKNVLSDKVEGSKKIVLKNNLKVNNDFKIVNGEKSLTGKFKQVKEKLMEEHNVKSWKQNETSAHNTEKEEKTGSKSRTCSFNKDNGNQTHRNSKREKKNYNTICYSKNAQEKDTGTWPIVCEKLNITDKVTNSITIPEELSKNTMPNCKSSSTKCIQDGNKSKTETNGQKLVKEQHQFVSVPNHPLNVEEEHGNKSPKTDTASDKQEEKLNKEIETIETIPVSDKNVAVTVTEKIHNENETHSKIANQKDCKMSLDKSKQNKTDTLPSSNDNNLPTVKKVVNNDIQLDNIEFCCTKCSFRTKHTTIFKTHLKEHGTEFFSGVISFLDLANSGKEATSQCESEQNEMKENNPLSFLAENKETQIINNDVSSGIDVSCSQIENKNCEPVAEANVAVMIVNEEKEEIPFEFNENEGNVLRTVTNVDSKSENMANLVAQSQHNQILNKNEMRLESEGPIKRKSVEETSPTSKKMRRENDSMYRCDECSYQSHKKRYFENHKLIHSKDIIKCKYCDFTTKLQRYITSHMLVHLKPDEIKMYHCPYCPYQTKRRGDLPVHVVIHKKPEEIQMLQCDKCPYRTKRKSNLRSHQMSHTSADKLPVYNCAQCSFTANKKCTLKLHMIVHQKLEDIEWYKCDQCSFITKYKTGLRRHTLVHKTLDEIKTYGCPVCHYQAKHKSHLKTHLLIHMDPNEVDMHQCEHCAYKSLTKSNLHAHMLQHKKTEEINMKKCAHCSYQTKLKCNLIKHINRIHGK